MDHHHPGSTLGADGYVYTYFITTHKRSLGQGNIFRSVCQEFCSQGGVPGPGGVSG